LRGLSRRRNDLDQAILHGDLHAQPAELAAGLELHVLEGPRAHVAGVRIEADQHAADSHFDKQVVVRLLDILGSYPLEHFAKQGELPVGVAGCRVRTPAVEHEPGLAGHEHQSRACRCTQEHLWRLAHHPRTLSTSLAAHHGREAMDYPVLAGLERWV
jgi:hypothetical protein